MSDFRPFFSFGQSFFGAMMQRLDSLRVKLFMAIAGANVVLVMVAYAIYGWSFDQGLVDYLNRADEARLSPLVTRLADGYRRHGDWRWISEDRQQWHDLVREVLGVGRMPRRGPEEAKDGVARPRPPVVPGNREGGRPPLTIDPRLLLLDARRDVLLGPAERAGLAVLRPIKVGEQIVGYLGYVPRLQVVTSLEQIFLTQQNRRFAAIALGLLAAVLLNAALIAHWLSRRLHALSDGAAALAQGDYAVRIPVSGHDELAQLAVDFNHLAQALEAAQRMRQQWIADIAHELRTPLATLRGEIEALQDGVRPLSQEGMASLAQELAQLTRLVEDLRMLSLSDIGALVYHKEPVDLREVLEDGLSAARSAVESRCLSLTMDLAPGVRVMGDESRLAQVVANLLQNTLRYSEVPATLEVRLNAEAGQALVVWEDSSPGVPPADLLRLTERLFRVDASRARASGGSGLGLSIAEAIVDAHGGRMAASPSRLGGLRWDIRFPLLAAG